MASVIDKLPEAQRKQVIDALLAGEALRDVAKLAGISHTAVDNYKRKVFMPTLQAAQKLNAAQEIAQSAQEQIVSTATLTRAQLAADPFIARVEYLRSERERIKGKAETDKDLRAWSSLDRNDLSELELHARLAGRLDSTPANQTNIQIVCPAGSEPTIRTDADGGATIDIGPGK